MSGWTRGREEILGMLERRELTQVTANSELAERLLATARQHLASARLLAASDPYPGSATCSTTVWPLALIP